MHSVEVTLNEEQHEKLAEGESIEVNSIESQKQVTINPPCGEFGHDWGYYKIDRNREQKDGSRKVTRRCKKCGDREEVIVDPEEIFMEN